MGLLGVATTLSLWKSDGFKSHMPRQFIFLTLSSNGLGQKAFNLLMGVRIPLESPNYFCGKVAELVYCTGLENRQARKGLVSSNLTLSAIKSLHL